MCETPLPSSPRFLLWQTTRHAKGDLRLHSPLRHPHGKRSTETRDRRGSRPPWWMPANFARKVVYNARAMLFPARRPTVWALALGIYPWLITPPWLLPLSLYPCITSNVAPGLRLFRPIQGESSRGSVDPGFFSLAGEIHPAKFVTHVAYLPTYLPTTGAIRTIVEIGKTLLWKYSLNYIARCRSFLGKEIITAPPQLS